MNTIRLQDNPHKLFEQARTRTEGDRPLRVALVYHDLAARDWAVQVGDFMGEKVGKGDIQSTEWRIGDLVDSGVFTLGVQALAKADVIVIAVHETDRFPGAFYLWVNLWLQVRSGRPGALLALLGTCGDRSPETLETRRYLYAVASQGGLELFLKECSSTASVCFEPDDFKPLAKAA